MEVFLAGIFFVAQDERAVEEALRGFRKAYAHLNPSNRAAAVGESARTPHERTLRGIGSLLSGKVKEVRIAAASGIEMKFRPRIPAALYSPWFGR